MTKNLTEGEPAGLIWHFTMPLIAGNIFQQLYAFVDTLIVGRWLGVHALAAVGCTGCLMFLLIGLILGTTNGLALVMGQRFGAGDEKGVRRSAATCLAASLIFAAVLTAVSVLAIPAILTVMETPPEIYEDAKTFIVIFAAATPIGVLFGLLTNVIRVLGDSRTATVMLALSLILNIAFEPVFILWLKWGVAGAALATGCGQVFSIAACLYHIRRRLPQIIPHGEDWHITGKDLYDHLRLGLPMGFQMTIIAMGTIVLQVALNRLGPVPVASYAAAMKVESIAIMPMISFGLAMAAFSAQNYGAGKLERISQGVKEAIKMSGGFSIAVGVLLYTCGSFFMEIFVEGESAAEVVEYGRIFLTVNGCCYFILSVLFILRNTLQGLGQTVVPTIAGVMELIMRSVAAFWLCDIYGYLGACWASPMAWVGSLLPLSIAYWYTSRTFFRQKN
ncbi:MAG: MATE family efflux transporter [Selenomonadaceae bacterium]|nr:MATE family efflux transporter [Selenomonadaceae bacterium]